MDCKGDFNTSRSTALREARPRRDRHGEATERHSSGLQNPPWNAVGRLEGGAQGTREPCSLHPSQLTRGKAVSEPSRELVQELKKGPPRSLATSVSKSSPDLFSEVSLKISQQSRDTECLPFKPIHPQPQAPVRAGCTWLPGSCIAWLPSVSLPLLAWARPALPPHCLSSVRHCSRFQRSMNLAQ